MPKPLEPPTESSRDAIFAEAREQPAYVAGMRVAKLRAMLAANVERDGPLSLANYLAAQQVILQMELADEIALLNDYLHEHLVRGK